MYWALSSDVAATITKVLSLVIMMSSPGIISTPFFSQVTVGVGTPFTGHLMVMVVFEAAVTLSPTFIVTGLPSPIGIFSPVSDTATTGFLGSEKRKRVVNYHRALSL